MGRKISSKKRKENAEGGHNESPERGSLSGGKVYEVTPTSGRGCQLADRGGWTRLGWAESPLKSSPASKATLDGRLALLSPA